MRLRLLRVCNLLGQQHQCGSLEIATSSRVTLGYIGDGQTINLRWVWWTEKFTNVFAEYIWEIVAREYCFQPHYLFVAWTSRASPGAPEDSPWVAENYKLEISNRRNAEKVTGSCWLQLSKWQTFVLMRSSTLLGRVTLTTNDNSWKSVLNCRQSLNVHSSQTLWFREILLFHFCYIWLS